MDFSEVALSAEDKDFKDRTRQLLSEVVTEDVLRRDRETGENFDERVHLALGAAEYLAGDWQDESDGGFSAVRRRIFQLEIARAHTPWYHWGTTAMVARMVQQFGSPELAGKVLPGVLSGQIRLCLGYTEPEGGSDVATCKTRAVRDGEGSSWIINGSKMFTSNAHNAQYVFLLTNSDPEGRKHRNLTMFLVPLDSPGIEIQGIRTLDGDRTNIVYYSDVRVDDGYRIGEVNGGWTVMRFALDAEHGIVDRDDQGLQYISAMSAHGTRDGRGGGQGRVAGNATGTRRVEADRRRVGEIPARPLYRADGGVGVHSGAVRTRRDRANDARHLSGVDGPVGCRVGAAIRSPGRRRRRRDGSPSASSHSGRDLRRDPRGFPQHDRPARTRARTP